MRGGPPPSTTARRAPPRCTSGSPPARPDADPSQVARDHPAMPPPAPEWRKTGLYVPKSATDPGAPGPRRKTGLYVPKSAMDPRWELDQAVAALADEQH